MTTELELLKSKIISEINNGHTLVKLYDNGLMVVVCTDDRVFNLSEIMQNHSAMKKLAGGEKRLVLTLAGKNTSINKEARKYLSLGLHGEFIKAEAFVLQSFAQQLLAVLYISLRRPLVKTNYFNNTTKALAWLKKIKE
jgi:hypothetical protein